MIKKIFNFQFSISNSSKGFTVLESIVAIMILSLSISGVFSVIQSNLSQSTIAKDEVKAFYLAQEAMEIIRNKRDANQLIKINNPAAFISWLSGITSSCSFDKVCKIDAISNSLALCGNDWDSCENLRQDSASFLYNYDGSDPVTNFKREIQIEQVQNDAWGNPIEIAVTVRISWTKGSLPPFVFKVKTHLFNWI